MHRFGIRVFLCALFALSGAAGGQVAKSSQPNLVAITFNATVMQTSEAKREFGVLQTKFAPRQVALRALNNEVEALRKELNDSAVKLSDTERGTKEQTLSSKEKQLQRDGEDFQNDTQEASQQAFQKVVQKVYVFLQSYAQEHHYDMVLERGSDATPAIWYATAKLDITDDVAKAYDARGVTGSTSALPLAPAPH